MEIDSASIDNSMRAWGTKLSDYRVYLDRDCLAMYCVFDNIPASATAPERAATRDDIRERVNRLIGPTLGFLCSILDGKVRD